jgi:hypothetical protein
MKSFKPRSGILAIAVVVACGGAGMRATGRDAGQGGGGVSSGGAGGVVDTGGMAMDVQGSAPAQGGSLGSDLDATVVDSSCDQSKLWDEIVESANLMFHAVYCGEIPDPRPDGGIYDGGYVVFDGDGRVIDNTVFGDSESIKQAWLDSLADYRWSCLAGKRIPFACGWTGF